MEGALLIPPMMRVKLLLKLLLKLCVFGTSVQAFGIEWSEQA